eukprot:272699-Rhodomonas_salina.3
MGADPVDAATMRSVKRSSLRSFTSAPSANRRSTSPTSPTTSCSPNPGAGFEGTGSGVGSRGGGEGSCGGAAGVSAR